MLVSVGWMVVCVLVFAAWLFFQLLGPAVGSAGSAGIGAVSVGISELILAVPAVPPILLVVTWLIARARRHSP